MGLFRRATDMATAHLISGLPCSGKTTYATALRVDLGAAVFSLDRWLITAFGKYSIDEIGHDEHVRRVLACRDLIWSAAAELLGRGVDVILDDGFFLRENRIRIIDMARGVGAATKIHFVDTPIDVLQERLQVRNKRLPPYNFRIGHDMLFAFVALFEPPGPDEGAEVIMISDLARPDESAGPD
jgi:predicted kinase